jgi:DnaJ family protein A protein 2
LVVQIIVNPHSKFEVKGIDLKTSVKISLQEALLGVDGIFLTHLDGRVLTVKRPNTPQPIQPGNLNFLFQLNPN